MHAGMNVFGIYLKWPFRMPTVQVCVNEFSFQHASCTDLCRKRSSKAVRPAAPLTVTVSTYCYLRFVEDFGTSNLHFLQKGRCVIMSEPIVSPCKYIVVQCADVHTATTDESIFTSTLKCKFKMLFLVGTQ
jgi:hypothetical protein